ncbi:MAG: hypothetical protein WBF99_04190 [Xanthobacteraceae bacterium]
MTKNQSARRRDIATTPKTARSRLTNGSDLLPGADQRTAQFRRYRDLTAMIATDIGGLDHLSEVKKQLVRRFAATSVLAEQLEARLVEGVTIDVDEHAKLSASLVKLAQRIGLGRHAKTVPDLQTYLASKQQQYDDADDDATNADVIEHDAEPAS